MNSKNFSLSLFGPFEASYNNLPITNFTTDKIRALLAYLAVESGKPHRRNTLASLLWPNYPDEISLRNLRQSLYRLRKTLQKVDTDFPDRLFSQTRSSITLHPNQISLDVSNFTQLIQDVKSSEDPIAHLNQIISLYRGDFLQGFSVSDAYAFDEWLKIQREILRQQAVESFVRLLALQESHGNLESILVIAPKLLALEPWHEETHRQIMRAYIQTGNRSKAIAQYQSLSELLKNELGVDPAPATTALFKQIETNIISVSSTSLKPDFLFSPQRHHIPTPASPIIGRQSEIDHLVKSLNDPTCRLLTITGPGGTGKTRLCTEVAHRLASDGSFFPHGIYFISLGQIDHSDQVAFAIAQTLGLTIQARKDPRKELINQIKNQNMLLILDNFEHLLASINDEDLPAATVFILDVLNSTSDVSILITSRDPLAIQLEWVYPLEGLPYSQTDATRDTDLLDEPAPQLFIQHAQRYKVHFDPFLDADAILEICRLTDGLPLAIEMAATWLRIHTCQEIVHSISQNLDFLTSPFRDASPRQRSIRVILNSTWEQLTQDQQSTLMALSVFRGGFNIQAALFVTQAHVLDLSILVEKSLLRRTNDNRYFLHELVAQFAVEKLAAFIDEYQIRERHAEFYFNELKEQTIAFSGSNPVEAVTHIRQMVDNLRTAWNWSVSQANLPMLEKGMKELTQFWIFTGANIEGETSIQKAITALQALPQEPNIASIHSYLASSLAWLQMGLGKNEDAEKNLQLALELADKGKRVERRATALSLQGWLLQNQGQLDEAETALKEAALIFEEIGDQHQLSLALIRTGSIYWWRNQLDTSLEYYEKSLHIEQKLGNKRGINRAYGGLGLAYMDLEKLEQALEYLEKALHLDRELGNIPGTVRNLGHLGNIYLRKGNYTLAVARYLEALKVEQKFGGKNTAPNWLSSLGRVYFRQQDNEKALEYYEEATSIAIENRNRHQLCEALLGKAGILIRQNRLKDAHGLIEEGLKISYEIDRKDTKLRGIILKARLLARNGDTQKARQLLESSRETLASEYKETETNARFFYELWKIDHETDDAQQSLALYKDCLSNVEQIEYVERIAELSNYLQSIS